MTRAIPAAILTALAQPQVELFHALEMSFDSGTVRLWTGFGNRTIDGHTYVGSGSLLTIDGIEEAATLSAKGITVSLAGVDPAIISLALQEPYQGRAARVLFGTTDVDDFAEIFAGLMDVMTIEEDGTTARISLTIESKLVNLQRPNIRRYTSESHKQFYPGDSFFDYVEDLQDRDIPWGRKTA